MKKLQNTILTGILLFSVVFGYSQKENQECKVLVPELKGEYLGGCKKGLAHGDGIAKGMDKYEGKFKRGLPHGKGTYIWNNGDIYEGQWIEGMREGNGSMKTVIDGVDTVLAGYWEEDEFIGVREHKSPYRIGTRRNIDRVSFLKRNDGGNTVYIKIRRGGQEIYPLTFMMVANSGNQFDMTTSRGYDQITFPFKCRLDFTAYSKNGTYVYDYVLEFEVFEGGVWDVNIFI